MIFYKAISSLILIALSAVSANEEGMSHSNIFKEELSSEGPVVGNGKCLYLQKLIGSI